MIYFDVPLGSQLGPLGNTFFTLKLVGLLQEYMQQICIYGK
jgi:hypothetical protein